MVAEAHVEPARLEEPVPELDTVCVTETVSERNVEMMVVAPEMSVTSVEPIKFVDLTSDVLELVLPTAETLMDPSEFAVTMDALVHVGNAQWLPVKTFDAEMDNVFADPNVM
jgi:predicted oxidoreductase